MPPRILLVEGESSTRSVVRAALDRDSVEVFVACTEDAALAALRDHDVDVVVADDSVPELSGTQFLKRVRIEHPRVKRVFVSDSMDPAVAAQAVNEAEVFRFLVRPCSIEVLARSVSEALEERARDRRFDEWLAREEKGAAAPVSTLRRALETLWVAFQPLFRADDRSPFGFEALARVEHPDVPHPERLFGMAEALGLVLEVDRAVRWRVAARMVEAPADATVFVNVHPRSLMDEQLIDGSEPLAAHADRVVLEITERSSLSGTPDLALRLERLRALGYRIALDDLGAGYAGLTTFALLAPDVVKFDMELVRNMNDDPTKAALIASMATLCREIGVTSVAEGIETSAELDAARRLGCDLVQGYHLGRPQRGFVTE